MKAKTSAGILLYKFTEAGIYFFLVHPGGPFFARKDAGCWTVPKGEPGENEDGLTAAKREFFEETGCKPSGDFIALDTIRQKGGKVVQCWAVEGEIDPGTITCNDFEIEWPPRSGKINRYPEVDRGAWFTFDEARIKINERQIPFLERAIHILTGRG